ncbi:MAG: hypothetical protein HQK52_14675 [Oligoflexia bacterium]|nr:hypothetical protein [Oligoflexia bacterium]
MKNNFILTFLFFYLLIIPSAHSYSQASAFDLDEMLSKVTARKQEITRIFYYNNLAKGESKEEALLEAEKEDTLFATNLMLAKLQMLKKGSLHPQQVYQLEQELLLLDNAFKDSAKKKISIQLLEDARVALFEQHIVQRSSHDDSLQDPDYSHFWKKPTKSIATIDIKKDLDHNFSLPDNATFLLNELVLGGHNPKIKVEREDKINGLKVKKWKCKFGEEVNVEIAASRFSRLLGFHSDLLFHVAKPIIYLRKGERVSNFKKEWLRNYQSELRWKRLVVKEGRDEKGEFVVFHEASCRPTLKNEKRIGRFYFSSFGHESENGRAIKGNLLVQAFLSNADIKEEHNNKLKLVESAKDQWEIVTLISDVGNGFGHTIFPNNPNKFSHIFIDPIYYGDRSNKSKVVKLNYRRYHFMGRPSPFLHAEYGDLKWMARYIAQVTQTQLKTLLQMGHWPPPLQRLYFEKLSHRRNDIVAAFELEREGFSYWPTVIPWPSPSLAAYNDGEHIQNGFLVKNFQDQTYDQENYSAVDYLTSIRDLYRDNNPRIKIRPFLKWDDDVEDFITIEQARFFIRGKASKTVQVLKNKKTNLLAIKLKVIKSNQSPEDLSHTISWINAMTSDPSFFILTPSLYGHERYGDLFIKIIFTFKTSISSEREHKLINDLMSASKDNLLLAEFLSSLVNKDLKIAIEVLGEYLPPDEKMIRIEG